MLKCSDRICEGKRSCNAKMRFFVGIQKLFSIEKPDMKTPSLCFSNIFPNTILILLLRRLLTAFPIGLLEGFGSDPGYEGTRIPTVTLDEFCLDDIIFSKGNRAMDVDIIEQGIFLRFNMKGHLFGQGAILNKSQFGLTDLNLGSNKRGAQGHRKCLRLENLVTILGHVLLDPD